MKKGSKKCRRCDNGFALEYAYCKKCIRYIIKQWINYTLKTSPPKHQYEERNKRLILKAKLTKKIYEKCSRTGGNARRKE